jgi:hypothetical protein
MQAYGATAGFASERAPRFIGFLADACLRRPTENRKMNKKLPHSLGVRQLPLGLATFASQARQRLQVTVWL